MTATASPKTKWITSVLKQLQSHMFHIGTTFSLSCHGYFQAQIMAAASCNTSSSA